MLNTNTTMPRQSSIGMPIASLCSLQLNNYCQLWPLRNGRLCKTALVLKAIALEPGITTDKVRIKSEHCSNVPCLVDAINKKLMNKGLMIIRIEPVGVAHNEAFHHWYLVEAPIMNVPVQMAVNDPIM
ncbi:hypothetical protein [Enterovibrio baiacu]|uniref:hypothetical protein n=1 Tax=Enterovibrio baiacu TaxID=2491023 RepID=UPI003D150D1D